MGKRNMRKGGMKGKRICPECDKTEETHNSADWYTREVVPQIGANFSVLTDFSPEPRLLQNGMYVNALAYHFCILTPPLDQHSSYHQKMLDLFTELREVNAGATNYGPVVLGCYMHNVVALRALLGQIRRGLAAVRHGNSLFRQSPNIFMAASGLYSYDAEAAAYAQNFNDFALLCKDVEELPIPPVSMLDRYEFLFDKIFCDSQTTRPALISFGISTYYTASESAGQYAFTQTTFPAPSAATATIANLINNARALYATIIGDQRTAIIRGDMIKAFGNTAMRRNLVSQVGNHFSIGYSADVVSQLENTAILGAGSGSGTVVMSTTGGAATFSIARGNDEAALILDETRRVINFHGETAPRDGVLMAITRLAVTGTNAATMVIDSASGVIPGATAFLDVNNGVTVNLGFIATWVHNTHSTIQSTVEAAYAKLMTFCTLVDHFPMVLHHPSDPYGAMLDIDNAAYISVDTLRDMTELANRSLFSVHIPRKSDGHFMR